MQGAEQVVVGQERGSAAASQDGGSVASGHGRGRSYRGPGSGRGIAGAVDLRGHMQLVHVSVGGADIDGDKLLLHTFTVHCSLLIIWFSELLQRCLCWA